MNTASMIQKLSAMTMERGATPGEAAGAIEAMRRILSRLKVARERDWLLDIIKRQSNDLAAAIEQHKAAQHLRKKGWEFRKCGKRGCHCMKGGQPHGPYRYEKRVRRDSRARGEAAGVKRTVYESVYRGKR